MNDRLIIDICSLKLNLNLINTVLSNEAGAVASFVGIIRNKNLGKDVSYVNYYVFNSLASSLLTDKCLNLLLCDKISKICIFQRHGMLFVGDINLIVCVSSVDRKTAFSTCSDIVEYVKYYVPIWKKEYYSDLSYNWVNSF